MALVDGTISMWNMLAFKSSSLNPTLTPRQQQILKSRSEMNMNIVAAGISSGLAVGIFNPLDCLRIRYQVDRTTPNMPIYKFFRHVVRQEGFAKGLWMPGLGSNVACFTFVSGLRYGLYPLARDTTSYLLGETEKSPSSMFVAGLGVGAFAFMMGMPFYNAKTLLQAEAGLVDSHGCLTSGARKGHARQYRHLGQVLTQVYRSQGTSGLFRGLTPGVTRGSLLSAGQTTSYDYTKTYILRHELMEQGPVMHVLCSVIAAFCAATLCAPADLVGSRWQTAPLMGRKYTSLVHCVTSLAKEEGVLVFYRGWSALFIRLAPVFCVSVPLYEELRNRLGIGYMD